MELVVLYDEQLIALCDVGSVGEVPLSDGLIEFETASVAVDDDRAIVQIALRK